MTANNQVPVKHVELKEMKSLFSFVFEHLTIIVEHSESGYEFFVESPLDESEHCFYALKTQRGGSKVYKSFSTMMKDIKEALRTSVDYMKRKDGGLKIEFREKELL